MGASRIPPAHDNVNRAVRYSRMLVARSRRLLDETAALVPPDSSTTGDAAPTDRGVEGAEATPPEPGKA